MTLTTCFFFNIRGRLNDSGAGGYLSDASQNGRLDFETFSFILVRFRLNFFNIRKIDSTSGLSRQSASRRPQKFIKEKGGPPNVGVPGRPGAQASECPIVRSSENMAGISLYYG